MNRRLLRSAVAGTAAVLTLAATGVAQDPRPGPVAPTGPLTGDTGIRPGPVERILDPNIVLVKQPRAGTATQDATATPDTPQAPVAPTTPAAPPKETSPTDNVVNVSSSGTGAAASQAASQPAGDLGSALGNNTAAGGVEVGKKNSIIADPRIRGLRSGQYAATSQGAAYQPARLDLDTPVSKFDTASVGGVRVVRGPYTTLLGYGFAFLDIAQVDTQRSTTGKTQFAGRSNLGYQSNGGQINGLQSVEVFGCDWGFRGTYNILQGSDYKDGAGNKVPSSYTSHSFNFGLGLDLTENLSVEFKGLRSWQEDVETPGLFFDIDRSDTEAYFTRFKWKNAGLFNAITADMWYNTTAGRGSTGSGQKQSFVRQTLVQSFREGNAQGTFDFLDYSKTTFAERSVGYRLAAQYGDGKEDWTWTFGTDLNVFGQSLMENVAFAQTQGANPFNNGAPIVNADPSTWANYNQQQAIPPSNSVNPGIFFENVLPVDKRLKVKSGARLDWVYASSNPRVISGNIDLFGRPGREPGVDAFAFNPIIYSANPGEGGLSRNYSLVSAFATAEYLLTDEATLFLGYGYAERAPTLTELYASGPFIGVIQQGTSRLIGDPNLAKERLNQLDAGVKWDYEYLQAGVSGFYSYINDYITYDQNKGSKDGLTQLVFSNTNLATLAGTELFLQADATEQFQPFFTLSYVQGIDQTKTDRRRSADLASSRRTNPQAREYSVDTEPLPQMPPLETRIGFRYHAVVQNREKGPKWSAEFSTRIVSGQNQVAASLGEKTTPGFTLFDVRGYYKLRDNWLVSGGVENIGDLLYREHLDPIASTVLRANTGNTSVAPLYRPGTNFFFNTQISY